MIASRYKQPLQHRHRLAAAPYIHKVCTPWQLLQHPKGCTGGAQHPSQVHRQGFATLCLLVGSGKGMGARQTVPLLERPGVVDHLQADEGPVRSSLVGREECRAEGQSAPTGQIIQGGSWVSW